MRITQFLTDHDVGFQLLDHPSTYDAQHLAQILHVPGRVVAKSVLLRANGGYTYIVAILPATMKIDLAKASHALGGSKLALASEIEIHEHCPDCEMGVLPPFGSQYGMKTILDESLSEMEEMVFEGNSHHDAVRMKIRDFMNLEQPLVLQFAVKG